MNMRITIGMKLAFTFGLLIVLTGLNVLVGMNGLRNTVQTYEAETLRIAETAQLTADLETQVTTQGLSVATYVLMGLDDFRDNFEIAVLEAQETAQKLLSMIVSEEGRALVGPIVEYQEQYAELAGLMVDGTVVHGTPEYDDAAAAMTVGRGLLTDAVDELAAYQAMRLEETRQEAEDAANRAQTMMTIVALVAIVGGIAVALWLTRSISLPVRQVAHAAERLADGDLTWEELQVAARTRPARWRPLSIGWWGP